MQGVDAEWVGADYRGYRRADRGLAPTLLLRLPMRMTRIIPMLPVASMPASVEFYEKLGFRVEKRVDEWRWAMLAFGECRLMVDESTHMHPGYPNTSVLYLYPDNITEYHALLRKNGVTVPDLEVSFYGMTEFRMDDLDGNRLWVGQDNHLLGNS